MPRRLSDTELAERSGQPRKLVERLVALGVVRPGSDGTFAPGDAALVRLIAAFEESGIDPEHIAAGVASGDIDYSTIGVYFGEAPPPAETLGELAERLGRAPDFLARLLGAFGLPQPAREDRMRSDEAEMVAAFLHGWELLEDEELLRLARLHGETLRRLAGANISTFEELVRQRVLGTDLPWDEGSAIVEEHGARLAPFAPRLVDWLYVRHFERSLVRYMADNTEEYLDEHGIRPRRPRKPPAIAFLDLTGFTSLTEEQGDRVAAGLASELALVVDEVARGEGGQAVKWLGDGVMFHFPEPAGAVRCALDLVARTTDAVRVPARVGVNAGPVVVQDGDYFGRTVNVAARIADYARPREVLVSQEALEAGGHEGVEFELIGEIPLKGISAPVTLHRARAR